MSKDSQRKFVVVDSKGKRVTAPVSQGEASKKAGELNESKPGHQVKEQLLE